MTADEQRFWYAITDSLPAALLTRADEQVIERMAVAWARYWKVKLIIADDFLLQGPNGMRRNPLLMVERDARDEMQRCGEIIGLSPVARQRISSTDPTTVTDPTELLLGGLETGAWDTTNVVPMAPPQSKKRGS